MATSNFGKAFRAAREAGDKEFEFNGKKYNTKMKDADSAESKRTAGQRKKGEALTSLMAAERNMPAGTSDLAKQKIKEAVGNAKRSYGGNPPKGVDAIDKGGASPSLKVLEDRDEDTMRSNIKAAQDYNRGRNMESEVLNNMITNPPMKEGGMVKKMASGGMATSTRAGTMGAYKPRRPGTTYEDSMTSDDIKKMQAQKDEAATERKIKTAPTTKTEMGKLFAKGGSVSSRADGIAQRGKTRGKMC